MKVNNMKQMIVFMISICLLVLPAYALADILVIANSSVSETSLSKQDVQLIFLGKKKSWGSGQKIKPAILKGGDTHEAFVSTYVEKTASSFSSYWKHAILSGTGIPPKSFSSEEDLVKYVAGQEGGVGYISNDTPHDGVAVLTVQ